MLAKRSQGLVKLAFAAFAAFTIFFMAGCSSLREVTARRPFADKVPYMGFQNVNRSVKSIGEIEEKDCQHYLFSSFPVSDAPTFEDLKKKLIREKQVVYMTDVSTSRGAEGIGFWKQECIYLKGVAYR